MRQSKYQHVNVKKLKQETIKELNGLEKRWIQFILVLVSKKSISSWSIITLLESFHYNIWVTIKLTCKCNQQIH